MIGTEMSIGILCYGQLFYAMSSGPLFPLSKHFHIVCLITNQSVNRLTGCPSFLLFLASYITYLHSEDLGERVTVEPHTLLIVYFDSRPSSPPLFVESKLLWPSLPTVPGQPQPLAYRIFDFSADVSWEVETPTSGGRRHRGIYARKESKRFVYRSLTCVFTPLQVHREWIQMIGSILS